ncbi:MAG TPA: hypothetical protein PKA64_23640 [Myxococcota bacterium]|nr:hypothetical protein [Myxococcota bacterium]
MSEQDPAEAPSTVVIDLGKRDRKQLKKLRRGEGKLMARLEEELAELVEQGVLRADAQTVVVVVEKKAKKLRFGL